MRHAAVARAKHQPPLIPTYTTYSKVGGSDASTIGSYMGTRYSTKKFTATAAMTVRRVDADLYNAVATTIRIGIASGINTSDVTATTWVTSSHGLPAYKDVTVTAAQASLSAILPDNISLANGGVYYFVAMAASGGTPNIGCWSSAPASLNMTWDTTLYTNGTATGAWASGTDSNTPYVRLYQGIS